MLLAFIGLKCCLPPLILWRHYKREVNKKSHSKDYTYNGHKITNKERLTMKHSIKHFLETASFRESLKISKPLLIIGLVSFLNLNVMGEEVHSKQELKDKKARVTIVFGAHDWQKKLFEKIYPNMTGGIRRIFDRGVSFSKSYQAHFWTNSRPGFTSLSHGSTPSVHGIIDNDYLLTTIPSMPVVSTGSQIGAFLFNPIAAPNGLLTSVRGAGPEQIIADTISDELILNAPPGKRNVVWGIGGFQQDSVVLAGKLGLMAADIKPNDPVTQGHLPNFVASFTTSLAYFGSLPKFINDFNKAQNLLTPVDSISWPLFFGSKTNPAYAAVNLYNYAFPGAQPPIAGNLDLFPAVRYTYETPISTKRVFDFAYQVIQNSLADPDVNQVLILFDSSAVDDVIHAWGANSYEGIDWMYWIDHQLGIFMDQVNAIPGLQESDVMWVFASDSGANPIPNTTAQLGYNLARPINVASDVVANGTVTFNGDLNNPAIIYTPNNNFVGADSFTYQFQDACGLSNTNVIYIGVGRNAASGTVTTIQNTPIAIHLGTIPGTIFTPAVSSVTVGTPTFGTVAVSGVPGPDPIITYTPPAPGPEFPPSGFSGATSFTYHFTDSTGTSNTGTITVYVEKQGFGGGGAGRTCNGQPVTIPLLTLLPLTTEDTSGTIFAGKVKSITFPDLPQQGTVSFTGVPGTGYSPAIVYTPNVGASGVDTFSFQFVDDAGPSTVGIIHIANNGIPQAGTFTTSTNAGVSKIIPLSSIPQSQIVPPITGYNIGTVSQTGTTVTGSGTNFTAAMVGALVGDPSLSGNPSLAPYPVAPSAPSYIVYADGSFAPITAFNSPTSLTVGTVLSEHNSSYTIVNLFPQSLKSTINASILNQFGIANIVQSTSASHGQVYLNVALLNAQPAATQQAIIQAVKQITLGFPGVSQAWTLDELTASQTNGAEIVSDPGHPVRVINIAKNSIYPGRSGHVIFNSGAYGELDSTAAGTYLNFEGNHNWWTENTAHAILGIWQPGVTKHAVINDPVWQEQLAATIAARMGVPAPQTSQFSPLDLPLCKKKKHKK